MRAFLSLRERPPISPWSRDVLGVVRARHICSQLGRLPLAKESTTPPHLHTPSPILECFLLFFMRARLLKFFALVLSLRQFDVNLPNNSPLRGDIEQACVNSVFGRRGVELLNKRGLAAMEAAGVPTVPAHTLVDGQSWATPAGDGRHYPYLVPMELLMFLNTLEGMQS